MTTLISENDRSILGIDTYERAAVWSGFVLIAANLANGGSSRNFGFEAENGILTLTINLSLNPQLIAQWTGDLFASVVAIDSSLEYLNNALSPSLGGNPIDSPPAEITNLEKYYLWGLQQIKLNGFLETEPEIIINNRKSLIETVLTIPYDDNIYLETNNYLEAIQYSAGNDTNFPFGNDVQLTNDYQLIN